MEYRADNGTECLEEDFENEEDSEAAGESLLADLDTAPPERAKERQKPLSEAEQEKVDALECALTSGELEHAQDLLKDLGKESSATINKVMNELTKALKSTLEAPDKNNPYKVVQASISWSSAFRADGAHNIGLSISTATNPQNIIGGDNLHVNINSDGSSTAQAGRGYHISDSGKTIRHFGQSMDAERALSWMFGS